MSKQPKKLTMCDKKAAYGTPAKHYESKRHLAAVQLNKELNKDEIPVGNSCTFFEIIDGGH